MVARYAIQVNGIQSMVLTKIDVLDKFETIRVCTGYKYKGKVFEDMPADMDILENCEPVYTEFEGWMESTVGIDSVGNLPEKARSYIKSLEELLGVGFLMLSTGPERDQTIRLGALF